MKCWFYVCNDNDNVINKTLENVSEKIDITFLNKDNFLNPIIRLKKELFENENYKYNYCKINSNFYYIREKNYYNNG